MGLLSKAQSFDEFDGTWIVRVNVGGNPVLAQGVEQIVHYGRQGFGSVSSPAKGFMERVTDFRLSMLGVIGRKMDSNIADQPICCPFYDTQLKPCAGNIDKGRGVDYKVFNIVYRLWDQA